MYQCLSLQECGASFYLMITGVMCCYSNGLFLIKNSFSSVMTVDIKNQTSKSMKSIKCVLVSRGVEGENGKKKKKTKKGEDHVRVAPLLPSPFPPLRSSLLVSEAPRSSADIFPCDRASLRAPRTSSTVGHGSHWTSTPTSKATTVTDCPRRSKRAPTPSSTNWCLSRPFVATTKCFRNLFQFSETIPQF